MKKFEAIRNEIKRLSNLQKEWKPLRKPERAILSNETPLWYSNSVQENKYELRHLFQAYATLKGKDRPVVTKKYINESKIDKLIDKYKEVE